jgi:xanthine dehydrogenase YagS FAD-binding subunit
MNHFEYSKPSTTEAAVEEVSTQPDAMYIAGGTNLIDLMKYNITQAGTLIDINHLKYKSIEEHENGVRLGALVTNADTAYHSLIEEKYPLLSRAILAGASAQIRNMATNGGNLLQKTRCYYFYDVNTACNKRNPGSGCAAIGGYNRIMAILGTSDHCIAVFPSDMCVALAALNAVVNVSGPTGDRTVAFGDFHRLPGDTPHLDNNLRPSEIITSIDLPDKGFPDHYSYLKLRDRNSYAFALVSVATAFELENGVIREARLALGGVAHIPWRAHEAESFLVGKEPVRENFEAAAEMALATAVGFEYNSFKIELAKRAIVRNCLMALNPQSQLPGAQPSE